MSRLAVIAALFVLATTDARATGGFSCSVDDQHLKLDAQSAFSHGLGERLVNFRAEAEVLDARAPAGLRTLKLDEGSLVHSWLYGSDLKLRLYRETETGPHGFIEIIVETHAPGEDDTDYEGTYRLVIFVAEGEEMVFNGKASCSVG